MKNFLKKNFWLIIILTIACFLRFYHLGSVPPSLDWDEAALGYNAYSILKTGRDEYGKILPFVFKSFGDYKPGLYVYLTIPFVALLGLTELAVRLPSAILGVFTVWLLYNFSLILFKKKEIAVFSAATLAILPWHLQFSRGAWEANASMFFLLLGVYFFFLGRNKLRVFNLSAIAFGASVICYQGAKMAVPLVILLLIAYSWKKIKTFGIRPFFWPIFLLGLISLPVFFSAFFGGGGRLKVMSVFSYRRPIEEVNAIAAECGLSPGGPAFRLFHGEGLNLLRGILGRYFNHFSGKFLFFEGDWSSLRHGPAHSGVLYLPCLLFLILGLIFLIRKTNKTGYFLIFWLLVSSLPAALSRDSVSAVRALTMVLPLSILSGIGLYYFFSLVSNKTLRLFSAAGIICIFSLFIGIYLDNYYVHYPKDSSEFWQYGYKEAVILTDKLREDYSKVVFTQKHGQPYIFWLFYNRYDPRQYQKQAKLKENPYGDVGQVERLDEIEFRKIYWPDDRSLKKILCIGTEEEIPLKDIDPKQSNILDNVRFLNDKIAFRIVETF